LRKSHVKVSLPVKRRRALVAINPLRNNRPELIANDEQSALLPSRSLGRARRRPTEGGVPAPLFKAGSDR
jgi:hypothetical protein